MTPDGPTAVQVTLVGGPCDGRIVHVWPRAGGVMPHSVEACLAADQRPGDDPMPSITDYHTYVRTGDPYASRTYVHAGEVLVARH